MPVVKVDQYALTAGEFSDQLAARLKVFDDLSAKDPTVLKQVESSVIQDFIVKTVTQEWAQSNQVFVRKEAIDAEVAKVRKDYPDDLAFRKSLADQGLTFDRWQENLKTTILQRLVEQQLSKNLKNPTDAEMKAFYAANKAEFQLPAAYHVRQIVLKTEADADRIKKGLNSGKRFADLAKKFSITPEGANGGDLGWVDKGTSNFFDNKPVVLKKIQEVKSPYGYHVYQILDKRSAHTLSFSEAKARIQNQLLADSQQRAYSDWLEKQILKAHVFKDDDLIKRIYVQNRGEH